MVRMLDTMSYFYLDPNHSLIAAISDTDLLRGKLGIRELIRLASSLGRIRLLRDVLLLFLFDERRPP